MLLSGEGHSWVALDYRSRERGGTPSVVWIDNERDQELHLAPDFRTFVERLAPSASFPG